MKRRGSGYSTRAIHGNGTPPPVGSPVSYPIHQSSTFVNPIGSPDEVLYTRYGNNPNQIRLGKKLAALEGSEDAILLASGMGATSLAHMAVLNPGDHLIASDWIYGGTKKLFRDEFSRLGIDVSFANPAKPDGWKQHLRETTRAVFVETPTNPQVRVIDLRPLAELCNSSGARLLVDATIASPINFRPLEHGADIVIHSATKYLNGHSDVIAGAVAGSSGVIERVRELMKMWGQAPDPHAVWLVERGLKTIAVRMATHNSNAQAFAEWASGHPKISKVTYPGLADHPDHERAGKLYDGFGGLVGIVVSGGSSGATTLLRNLKLATHAPSFGGVETLVSEPRYTSHAGQPAAELGKAEIAEGFVRVSVGIEDVSDIISDFESALNNL